MVVLKGGTGTFGLSVDRSNSACVIIRDSWLQSSVVHGQRGHAFLIRTCVLGPRSLTSRISPAALLPHGTIPIRSSRFSHTSLRWADRPGGFESSLCHRYFVLCCICCYLRLSNRSPKTKRPPNIQTPEWVFGIRVGYRTRKKVVPNHFNIIMLISLVTYQNQ